MDIYIVRHAIAFEADPAKWPDDRDRPLAPRGERRFQRAARGLRTVVPEVAVVLSSPYRRAWQTAKLLQHRAGWPEPVHCAALEPGHTPDEVIAALSEHAEAASVAVVGHEPHLHELLSYLVTGDAQQLRTEMRRGGVACVRFEGELRPGAGLLRWVLPPRVLRKL